MIFIWNIMIIEKNHDYYFKQFQTSCKTDVYWIKVDISLDIIQNS